MAPTECQCHSSYSKSNFKTPIVFSNVTSGPLLLHANITNVLTVSFMEKYAFASITTLAGIIFSYVRINQCAKSDRLWKSLSVYWCPARLWYVYRFNSLRVMRLNDDTNRSVPFRHLLTFELLSSNACTISAFSSVAARRFLSEFLLFLFRIVPKLRYFAALFLNELLTRRFTINY